jgi:four helix bundle protein
MQRASVSIPSNIAEGCSRISDTEFARYLEISLGSAFELETQLIIISKLKLLDGVKSLEEIFSQIEKVQKMINSFKTKVLKT